MKKALILLSIIMTVGLTFSFARTSQDGAVKVGLNYPKTGPYSAMGLDQWQAANLAVEEINAAGGVLGKQVEISWRDSESKKDLSTKNVTELIDNDGCKMIFGGSASSVAVAAGAVCQEKQVPFFGTLTYSTATTGTEAHRFTFRECYDAYAGAKVLAKYMKENFAGKKFLYITADYTWGHTTEAAFRKFTDTEDTSAHKGMMTPFPGATEDDFKKAISFAKLTSPDVLVLVLFGKDMEQAVRQAMVQSLKSKMQIVVPNLTLGMAEGGGPKVMEGVVGALPWCWQIPYEYGFDKGKQFVENFASKYNRYPSTSGASAYTILHQWKEAVESAGSFDGPAVVKALEGKSYTLLKDEQTWRDWDHQSIQTVYAVRCKPDSVVMKDKFKQDYFEIIDKMAGSDAFCTREEWNAVRQAAGKPTTLEALD